MPQVVDRFLCIEWCRDLSICLSLRLSVPPGLGQLGAQCLVQATKAVQTVDPSAHRHKSAGIGGAYRLATR